MNRRTFLKWLGVAVPAVVVAPQVVIDVERELWVPGARTYFDLWHPHRQARPVLSSELLERYVDGIIVDMRNAANINRDYSREFRLGNTVVARFPQRYQYPETEVGVELREAARKIRREAELRAQYEGGFSFNEPELHRAYLRGRIGDEG